jgi:hypothetical protein
MQDECGVNELIIFLNTNPLWKNNNTRRGFLKDLGLELVRPHMNERLTIRIFQEDDNYARLNIPHSNTFQLVRK